MTDPAAILARFPGPVRLLPSRRKWLLVLLGCLVFLAADIAMKGDQPKTRWFGIAFFGLGTLVSAGMLVPTAAHLTLDGEGFEATVLFRRFPTRWEDASRFEAATTPIAGRPVVMFDDATAGHSILRQRNRGPSGRNASLADTYGLTSQNLASLMEDWRERALHSRSPS